MIRIDNLTKTYHGVSAVADISLTVERGEIFAFLGPNGAGKTTTMKMLTTLIRPTSGSIHICGVDIVKQQHRARRHLGVVFQEPSLDQELTAAENMDLQGALYSVPRTTRRQKSADLLKTFELWDRRNEPVFRFSGGMKRRLEIARCLLHNPQVLFLDEPMLGLDPQSRNLLWKRVSDLSRTDGLTVFMTTHLLDEAERVASHLAIIDHGRIIAAGSAGTLRSLAGAPSLESAFLSITGTKLRDDFA